MSCKGLNHKTFRVLNKTWLKHSADLIFAAFIIHFVVYLCELGHLLAIKASPTDLWIFLGYMFGYFIFTIISIGFVNPDDQTSVDYKGWSCGSLIMSLLFLLVYFNQWFLERQWNGVFSTLKRIPPLQVVIFPITIICLWFSAWINWRVDSAKLKKYPKKQKVKKTPKALSKKTLGMRNKTWINLCLNLMSIVATFWVVMFFLDFYVIGKKINKIKLDDTVLFLQGAVFIDVIILFPILYFCLKNEYEKDSPESYRKQALFTGISTVFVFFYFFNPWTLESFMNAKLYYEYFLFFSMVQLIGIPIILVSLSFYTWIYWRMSKVKPDYDGNEPYLVIYGGEESSTKMIIVE